ncbi:MAG: extracellular solute-binding protein [Pseudomonadota bacterium]
MMQKDRRFISLVLVLVVIWIFAGTAPAASKKPSTVAELALYGGTDRQQILEEGARKEGKLVFYTSGVLKQAVRPIVDAFEARYPFVKVEVWRTLADQVGSRVLEEYKSGRHLCDVIEGASQINQIVFQNLGVIQPFSSPNFVYLDEDGVVKAPGGGAFAVAFRESGVGIGYNTKLIAKEQLPKTYKELVDPKWKGQRVTIGSGNTVVSWVGAMADSHGNDLVERLAGQNFTIQTVSAAALLDLIINGEFIFSPTIYDSHVFNSQQKGAPVGWAPLEPVPVFMGQMMLPKYSLHPHAALLFIDFELSKGGAEIHRAIGYNHFSIHVNS